jgi:hypothetical protein
VDRNIIAALETTLDEARRGEIIGLTIVVSNPGAQFMIRRRWENRLLHLGALAQALHDTLADDDDTQYKDESVP